MYFSITIRVIFIGTSKLTYTNGSSGPNIHNTLLEILIEDMSH